jgi:PKD repeat protein
LNVAGDTLSKFISTPRYGVFPFRVDFNNLSINSNTYLWDFGDGDTSTEANPTHYYSAPGKYTVTLTSINSTDTDIKVKEVYINSVSNKYQLNGYLSGSGIVEVPYKACSEFVTLGWIKSPLCANGEYLIPLAIGDINGKVVDSDRALKFMLKKENNDFRFVFNNSESQLIFKSVSINLQDDSWHSLGWVCVDSSGTMKFLVDGVEVPVRLGYNSSTGLVYSKAYSSVGRVGGGEVWCPYLSNSGQRITLYNWRFAKGVSLDNNWIEELFKIDKLNLGLM